MVSGADIEGLRHNPRHSGTLSLAVLQSRPVDHSELRLRPEVVFFRKWGVLKDDDPNVVKIQSRLAGVLDQLSAEEGLLFLIAADCIAEAERAKDAWNPKANRARYARLCKSAISAARLAIEISVLFPQPWEGKRAQIGDLVAGLAGFIEGILRATTVAPHAAWIHVASQQLQEMRGRLSKKTDGRTHWELIADLVSLASGKQGLPCSERTVRRYLV